MSDRRMEEVGRKGSSDEVARAVRVRLFSVLREKLGTASLEVEIEEPVAGQVLLDQLSEEYPAIAAYRSVLRLAVGEEYVAESTTVCPGDEVVLITPVSGG